MLKEALQNLNKELQSNAHRHDLTAAELSILLCRIVRNTLLKNDNEDILIDAWEEQISKLRCELLTGHDYELDHCGYWGHKFCYSCGGSEYPELSKLSCSEAIKMTKGVSEDEYKSKRHSRTELSKK